VDVAGIEKQLGNNRSSENNKDAKVTADDQQTIAEKSKMVFTGLVAQEVQKAAKDVNYNFSGVDTTGTVWGLRYSDFVVPLVKAVQELSKDNNGKDSKIDTLQKQVDELKSMMQQLQQVVEKCSPCNQQLSTQINQSTFNKSQVSGAGSTFLLEQNTPNPFNHTTTIRYTLPLQYTPAQIIITDNMGRTVRQIDISGSGKGNITVDASLLSSSSYRYSLVAAGKLIDTKQMTMIK
jgi:uncharacterized protein YoxC